MSMRARTLTAAAPLALAAAALSGCGNDGDAAGAAPTATVTVTATTTPLEASETPEPTATSTGPAEPNVGDQALRVGETREGTAVTTTLEELRFPYPADNEYRTPEDPNNVFVGLRLTQCLKKGADATDEYGEPMYSTLNNDFAVVTPDGTQYAGSGSSWNDWPAPKFPEYVTMNPGDCLKGWIALEAPKTAKISKVVWRPGGQTVAEWLP